MAQRGASLQLNSAKNSSLPASSVVEWHQAEEEPAWQKLSPNSQRPPFLSPLTSTLTYPWFVTSRRYIEKCIFRNNFFCMTFIYLEAGKWKLGRKQKRRKSAKWELLLVLESKESAFSTVAGCLHLASNASKEWGWYIFDWVPNVIFRIILPLNNQICISTNMHKYTFSVQFPSPHLWYFLAPEKICNCHGVIIIIWICVLVISNFL